MNLELAGIYMSGHARSTNKFFRLSTFDRCCHFSSGLGRARVLSGGGRLSLLLALKMKFRFYKRPEASFDYKLKIGISGER